MEVIFDGSMSVDEFIVKYNEVFGVGDTFTYDIGIIAQLPLEDVYNLTAFLEYNRLLPIPTAHLIIISNNRRINEGLLKEISSYELRLS